MASNKAALVGWFCRAVRNSRGFSRRALTSIEMLVVSLSVPATSPTALARSARASTADSEASPTTTPGSESACSAGSMMVTSRPPARRSATISRPKRPYPHHPPSVGWWMAALGKFRARTGLEPGEQLVRRRCVQRQPEMLAKSVEGIHHRRRLEGTHPLSNGGRDGPRDNGQVGTQQRRRHRDCEIGLIVVGERQYAGTEGMVEPGCAQVVRIGGVGRQSWKIGVIGPQLEGVDAVGRVIDHHQLLSERIEILGEQLARASVAGHQKERLTQPRHCG